MHLGDFSLSLSLSCLVRYVYEAFHESLLLRLWTNNKHIVHNVKHPQQTSEHQGAKNKIWLCAWITVLFWHFMRFVPSLILSNSLRNCKYAIHYVHSRSSLPFVFCEKAQFWADWVDVDYDAVCWKSIDCTDCDMHVFLLCCCLCTLQPMRGFLQTINRMLSILLCSTLGMWNWEIRQSNVQKGISSQSS